jgi:outer membrane protein OmpA-like peptidoglycan-associated protein
LVLSQRRAEAVRDALVGAGVDAKRITTFGMGQAQPVAPNTTEEGRAKNRRVDVILGDR